MDETAKQALEVALGEKIILYQFRDYGEDISQATLMLLNTIYSDGSVAYMKSSLDPELENICMLAQTVLIYDTDGTFEKTKDEFRFAFRAWDFKKRNGKEVR